MKVRIKIWEIIEMNGLFRVYSHEGNIHCGLATFKSKSSAQRYIRKNKNK